MKERTFKGKDEELIYEMGAYGEEEGENTQCEEEDECLK